jgi:hypothetical protein
VGESTAIAGCKVAPFYQDSVVNRVGVGVSYLCTPRVTDVDELRTERSLFLTGTAQEVARQA